MQNTSLGVSGQPWGAAEIALWRQSLVRQRSYADDVLSALQSLGSTLDLLKFGQVTYAGEMFPLMAVRSQDWSSDLPSVLITAGVHGYETSGVQGALHFLATHAKAYTGRVNLLVVPCVSPWAYERVQRWNFDALDPNRSFKEAGLTQESAALMQLIAPLKGQFAAHIDLHETTDSDETEFRPALAARDGETFEPGQTPDGFYLVDDAANLQPAFQSAIIAAVSQITHIALEDQKGEIIDSPIISPGVIAYPMQALGLCASISQARYTSTTEVYPDSPRTTPEQCVLAQVAALVAGIEFVILTWNK
jgi:Succinylglutamate desuccinylase / Aspartoacylase family